MNRMADNTRANLFSNVFDGPAANDDIIEIRSPIKGYGKTIQKTFHGPWMPAITGVLGTTAGVGFGFVVFVIVLSYVYASSYNFFTDANTTNHSNSFLKKWEPIYGTAANGRKSLNEYLASLSQKGLIQPNQKCLSNFYIMTANTAGIVKSPDGVLLPGLPLCSIQSISFLLRAGVRGFIFNVHELLSDPGKPYLSVVDPDPNKKWRTISMNTIPFRDPINRLRAEAFGEGSLGREKIVQIKNTTDPIFIYLRFIRQHKPLFYNNVANDLQNAFKDYRLDYTWASGRRETDFYTTDIQEFMGKVVIMSNQKASGTNLEDFINIAPVSSLPANYKAVDIKNITTDEITKIKPVIQQHVCTAFDVPGTAEAMNNSLDWKRAQQLGIQMVGMNFFTDAGDLAGYRGTFGENSFSLKPENMRYGVQLSRAPIKPGAGADMKGGNITVPDLQLRT